MTFNSTEIIQDIRRDFEQMLGWVFEAGRKIKTNPFWGKMRNNPPLVRNS